jgi:hypothetical protein
MVDLALQKTSRAKIAACEIGFPNTSASLEGLRRQLLSFKHSEGTERNFRAYDVDEQIKKTHSAYVDEANNCEKVITARYGAHMKKTFRIAHFFSFVSLSCLLLATLEAAARDAKAVMTTNAVVTGLTLACCYLVYPALQMSIFNKMVRENIKAINEAICECKKLLEPYTPGHSKS